MTQSRAKAWSILLASLSAAIVAVIVALGAAGVFDDDTDQAPTAKQQAPIPAAIAVDGPDRDAQPDDATVPLTNPETRELIAEIADEDRAFDVFSEAGELRGEDRTPVARSTGPLATPNFPGCTTRILPTNWSNRVVPMSEVDGVGLHYTAGGNLAGLADMNGLTGYASSPSAGVSWHFLIDAEGHCYYQVPLQNKAWTIGNLNSETVNIEVIQRGSEATYPAGSAGAAKLRSVVRELGRRLDIPMRVGSVSNCHVVTSGIVTHYQGGTCAGGHKDILDYSLAAAVRMIAADPCGDRCHARRRQRKVVAARVARHDETHQAAKAAGCRGLDKNPPSSFGRERCRELKLKHRHQRARIRKARATLRAI